MRIAVIPDVQAKPGVDFKFLTAIGKYIAEKRPEVIVHLGDHADMPSLSSYDKGKRKFEGRRYTNDIAAAQKAMETLMTPIASAKGYNPRMELFLGNHEDRINRATNDTPELHGLISTDDLKYPTYGWTVHPFLEVAVIRDIAFSHYFTSGVMGRPVTTSAALLAKKHMSCIAGHQQGFMMSTANRADGKMLTGIIAGSCYEHKEDYLGPQGNVHFRGMLFLNDVRRGGEFDVMPLTLAFLKRRYK